MRHAALIAIAACWLMAMPGDGLAQPVGVAAAVNQSALGTPPSQKTRTLVLGDAVIHDEKIVTNGAGLLQILLADGTSFTVGPNSTMTIDSFVYDPAADTAKVVATLGKGVFRFIGGRTSKAPDGAVLNTPAGTVGIRGGISDLDFSGKGLPFHIDLLFGHSIVLADRNGQVLGRIYEGGYSLVLGPDGKVSVVRTPPGWTQSFQAQVTSHGNQNGGTGRSQGTNGTQMANGLGGVPAPPGRGPAGPLPGDGILPPVPFTAPDEVATWAEINNSSLANVYASYAGDAAATLTANVAGQNDPVSYDWSGKFALDYYFGAANGGGLFSLSDSDGGQTGGIPVLPLDPQGTGAATFGAHYDLAQGCDCDVQAVLDVNGHFINSGGGIASKVGGTFTFTGGNGYFEPPGGGPVAIDSLSVNGSFGGNLQHTSPGN